MIQRRTHVAPNGMSQFVPLLGAAYSAPSQERHCPRCACRLSRYAGASETYCAPCAQVLHPWAPPPPRPGPATVCLECGGYKKATSKRCRRCREANPMTGERRTCPCGRLARRGRKRCSHCDRERAAQ